jgi:hypothetical protein
MEKFIMPELVPEERLQYLINACDGHEQTTYYKDLTQDELDSKREKLVDNLIKVSQAEDVLNEYKAEFKSIAEPLKLENKSLQFEVKTGKAEIKGRLFHFADHINGFMNTYDESGEFVSSRRLRPDEKQARLYIPPKAVGE